MFNLFNYVSIHFNLLRPNWTSNMSCTGDGIGFPVAGCHARILTAVIQSWVLFTTVTIWNLNCDQSLVQKKWQLSLSGRVLSFCADMGKSGHWACQAFDNQQGKKVLDVLMDNARKRESNNKLLQTIETAISEQLGSSDNVAVLDLNLKTKDWLKNGFVLFDSSCLTTTHCGPIMDMQFDDLTTDLAADLCCSWLFVFLPALLPPSLRNCDCLGQPWVLKIE